MANALEVAKPEGWLDAYCKYTRTLTDAPVDFHFATALTILATACGSSFTYRSFGGHISWPNLYTIIIAPSGLYRKGTAINIGGRILKRADNKLLIHNEQSREQFLATMASQPTGLMLINEFSAQLALWGREYMCVDTETEIFTTDGFKKWDEVKAGDTTFGLVKYGPAKMLAPAVVERVNTYDVAEIPMIALEGRSISMLTTLNHKQPLYQSLQAKEAKDLKPYDKIPQLARWSLGKLPNKPAVGLARLIGWYVTEGWDEGKSIRIGQKTHVDELCYDLKHCRGLHWNEQKPGKNGLRIFRIHSESAARIREWTENKVPKWEILFTWSNAALRALYEAMMLGDGSKGNIFTQKSQARLDFFQALCFRLRKRAVIYNISGANYSQVSVSGNHSFQICPSTRSGRITYTGKIWCPTTSLGTWVARRHGRIFITGNSGMKELITDLFDPQLTYRRVTRGGAIEIKKPALNILAATTSDWLQEKLTVGDMRGGLMGRFLIIPGRHKEPWKGLIAYSEQNSAEEEELASFLQEVRQIDRAVVKTDGIAKSFNLWLKDMEREIESSKLGAEMVGFKARIGTHALKLAVLFEISNMPVSDSYTLTSTNLSRAINLASWLYKSTMDVVEQELVMDKYERQMQKVMRDIGNDGIQRQELLRLSHLKAQDFDKMMSTLMERGQVEVETIKLARTMARVYHLTGKVGKSIGENEAKTATP